MNTPNQSPELRVLVQELYADDQVRQFESMYVSGNLDLDVFTSFDYDLGGPSCLTIADPAYSGGTLNMPGQGVGRYHVDDREVFRPLQYCSAHLMMVREDAAWLARAVVRDASAHVEALLQRIARKRRSFGMLLRQKPVVDALDPAILEQAQRFAVINNAAKHDYDHPKDTHMFSYEDALAAYFIARRLGQKLYPIARLQTDLAVFAVEPAIFIHRSGHLRPG